jgi:Uma2 family endonuclease
MAVAPALAGESRVLLQGVSWSLYQQIAAAQGDRPVPRLTYCDGSLELMSPSYLHETLVCRFRVFVLMLARGLGRTCLNAGSARWEKAGVSRAREPDACFYLANEPAARGLTEIDLDIHPPPDLAVEVELTDPLSDALLVYAGLGVPEVWRYNGRSLRFYYLQDDGSYAERPFSRGFPALGPDAALAQLLRADGMDLAAWSVEVEAWARQALADRDDGGNAGR